MSPKPQAKPTASRAAAKPTSKPSRLAAAVRTNAQSLIYGVTDLAAVLEAIDRAAHSTSRAVDCRRVVPVAELKSELLARAKDNGPLVVLLGAVVAPNVRAALDAVLPEKALAAKPVFALTSGVVTPELGALFALQMAAVRVLEDAT